MISPGAAGFSLSAAMSTTRALNWLVRTTADTEAQMNSVERILQCADDIPQEMQVISGGASRTAPQIYPATFGGAVCSPSMMYCFQPTPWQSRVWHQNFSCEEQTRIGLQLVESCSITTSCDIVRALTWH